MEKFYEAPEVEVLEVKVEKGYINSMYTPDPGGQVPDYGGFHD